MALFKAGLFVRGDVCVLEQEGVEGGGSFQKQFGVRCFGDQ